MTDCQETKQKSLENLENELYARIKIFSVTIHSEVKRPQTQCLSPKGEF